jgi:hypothetical protein
MNVVAQRRAIVRKILPFYLRVAAIYCLIGGGQRGWRSGFGGRQNLVRPAHGVLRKAGFRWEKLYRQVKPILFMESWKKPRESLRVGAGQDIVASLPHYTQHLYGHGRSQTVAGLAMGMTLDRDGRLTATSYRMRRQLIFGTLISALHSYAKQLSGIAHPLQGASAE